MRDRIALPLMLLTAAAMIALALVWPQGQGRRSPPPFGHAVAARTQNITVGGRTITSIRGAQDVDESLEQAVKDRQ